jgi:hypothetical protein
VAEHFQSLSLGELLTHVRQVPGANLAYDERLMAVVRRRRLPCLQVESAQPLDALVDRCADLAIAEARS